MLIRKLEKKTKKNLKKRKKSKGKDSLLPIVRSHIPIIVKIIREPSGANVR